MPNDEYNIGDFMSMTMGLVMLVVVSSIADIFTKKEGDITVDSLELA